jgi:transcriptional regulatory protein LEU3
LQLNCARIHILAFHFFAHPTNPGPDAESLTRFFSLCINVIHAATALLQQSYFSFAMDRSITLAGFVILKLVRSSIAPNLDLAAGEKAYFQAIQFLKSVSLQQGDIYVRTALIMSDLWNSSKVFRKKNGQFESLGLRLRTRLGMSVSYDMFWYWREEFGNMQNPYGEETTAPSNDPTQPTTPREQQQYHIDTPMLTDSARASMQQQQPQQPQQQQQQQHQHQQQQQQQPLPGLPMSSQIPLTKFDPSLVQIQPDPSIMSFDTWDGSDYNVPPIMDQFPDYDWAAGFDFSNTEFPTVPAGPVGGGSLMPGGMGNMGYTFG